LLHVALERVAPEEAKPRSIKISSDKSAQAIEEQAA
jgi:hypothetical protein